MTADEETGRAPYPTSKEAYEAAGDAWFAATARMDAARAEARAAETALYAAVEELARHEAAPGIPAYWHATVPAAVCRIGRHCKIHGEGADPW